MAEETKILTICGSLRSGSINRMVTNTLPELAPGGMSFSAATSFGALPVFDADVLASKGHPQEAIAIAEAIAAADGVVIVSPEYNFSLPGGLKNMLDWVSRTPEQPFQSKPVAIQSAAPGPVGGTRMQYHLRQVMVFLDARVLNKPEVFITLAAEKFDTDSGKLVDEASRDVVRTQLSAFKDFIAASRS